MFGRLFHPRPNEPNRHTAGIQPFGVADSLEILAC
jgi:hypothetical protein